MVSAADRLAGQRVGNYRFERILGQGRMGVVYAAWDEALLRPTAVKVLHWSLDTTLGQDPLKWFLAEARHVAQINHPAAIQIYGVARHRDIALIAMEFVDGPSAEELVDRQGPLPADKATEILIDVASALQAAHGVGIVHRDVKPANILLGSEGAKLGDFGLALSTRTHDVVRNLFAGTPHFAAPESWRGCVATASADIYALGATYYYLLTGKPPFPARNPAEARQMHLTMEPPDPRVRRPELPEEVAHLVRQAMAKSPEGRLASCEAVQAEGRAVLEVLKRKAAAPPKPPSPLGPVGPQSLLTSSLGFQRSPFFDVDAADPPYRGPPFDTLSREVKAELSKPGARVLLTGAPGSGRSTFTRTLGGHWPEVRGVHRFALSPEAGPGSVVRRLARGLGVQDATPSSVAERLLELDRADTPVLLVVDELGPSAHDELMALLEVARPARALRLVVVHAEEHRSRWEGWPARWSIPPLVPASVRAYIEAWLSHGRSRVAPALMFTPDAHLLIAARSQGILSRINILALNALALAASYGRRVITSFEAWHAPSDRPWPGPDASTSKPSPPGAGSWPTPEVQVRIAQLRRRASLEGASIVRLGMGP